MLETLFGSRVRKKLVVLFSTSAGKEFYVRQLARNLSERPNAVLIELNRLEKLGFLSSHYHGNMRLYGVNVKCPFYPEMKGMVLKTEEFGSLLKDAVHGVSGVKFAFIFGSFAKGEEKPSSDIDLMIVGSPDSAKVSRAVAKAEKALSRAVNYIIYPEREFLSKRKNGFLSEVISGRKIWLAGDRDGFERFAQ